MTAKNSNTPLQFIEAYLELEEKGVTIDWKAYAIKLAQALAEDVRQLEEK